MSARDSIGSTQQSTFEQFKWYSSAFEQPGATIPAEPALRLSGQVRDITHGAQVIAEILESDLMRQDDGELPIYSSTARGHLMRMMITSLGMLENRVQEFQEWAAEHHLPKES